MALHVVTDSTCDLPREVIEELGITVVPCNVHFGDELLQDGVDISPSEFYRRLDAGPIHPTTSQPSVGAFLKHYEGLKGKADEVLSLHVSAKLSGTYNSAVLAQRELKDGPRIEVVDSLQVSLGLGLLVREVARIAKAGGSLDDALGFLRAEIPNVLSYVTVDTLEHLVRGGRASRLQGFFAGILDIKPVIVVRDGETHPAGRSRTRRKALAQLPGIAASSKRIRAMGLMHALAPDDAEALAEECTQFLPRDEILISEFTPVMGCHLGSKAVGLAIWSEA
jgi:DegV family protein with EDD domain